MKAFKDVQKHGENLIARHEKLDYEFRCGVSATFKEFQEFELFINDNVAKYVTLACRDVRASDVRMKRLRVQHYLFSCLTMPFLLGNLAKHPPLH